MWIVLMENAKLHLGLFPNVTELYAASPALEPTLLLTNALQTQPLQHPVLHCSGSPLASAQLWSLQPGGYAAKPAELNEH